MDQADRPKVKRVLAEQGRTAAWLAQQLGYRRSAFEQYVSTNPSVHREPPPLFYERIAGLLNMPLASVRPDPEPVEALVSA